MDIADSLVYLTFGSFNLFKSEHNSPFCDLEFEMSGVEDQIEKKMAE